MTCYINECDSLCWLHNSKYTNTWSKWKFLWNLGYFFWFASSDKILTWDVLQGIGKDQALDPWQGCHQAQVPSYSSWTELLSFLEIFFIIKYAYEDIKRIPKVGMIRRIPWRFSDTAIKVRMENVVLVVICSFWIHYCQISSWKGIE